MSIYSGKCDVADMFEDYSDNQLQQCNFYLNDNIVPLRIDNQHDLSPYYPYLVSYGGGNKGIWNCHITSRSYIDIEEEEHLTWKLRDFQRYYRKCKRNKVPYVEAEAIKNCIWSNYNDIDKEIAHRVGIYGDKATIEGLHDSLYEYYREKLLNRMIELGWDKKLAKYWIWKDWGKVFREERK